MSPLLKRIENTDSLDFLSAFVPIDQLLDRIQCPHRADEGKFLLVDKYWFVHV